jgi:tRNA U34 5-carboxymethylaminomethyl modifying GTPase MnmE/TrmE
MIQGSIIAALASAPGKAGISVVRVSGKGSAGIVREFLTSKKSVEKI